MTAPGQPVDRNTTCNVTTCVFNVPSAVGVRGPNIYVGYYATQRTGATYHSPQNCLPGAGWQLKEPQTIDIAGANGRTFQANLYIIENGIRFTGMPAFGEDPDNTEDTETWDLVHFLRHLPSMSQKILVIVPTYNERDNLPSLVKRVMAQPANVEMLVVEKVK